jgi:CRISPR system Cascade subunit CasC
MRRIEIHILQNFAPANLNRDDTGSPKDCEFGSFRRGRVSSQCQKRADRLYFQRHELIPAQHRAERTKRLVSETAEQLVKAGKEKAAAERAARVAVTAVLPKTGPDNNGEVKTPYLLFLGRDEIRRFTELVSEHFEALATPPPAAAEPAAAEAPARRRGRGRATGQAAQGPTLPEGFEKAVKGLLDGGKAADLALFGRMLADLPEQNIEAACQVAHAISTNRIHRMEMDYYTAVDDLKPEDTAGADMIGTVEFNSSCFYRYANLDLDQLLKNLQGDGELARMTVEAFLEAFVHAIPTGKQNTFAAHNPPSLVFALLREGQPVSLANAFVKPVTPSNGDSLVEKSIGALDGFYGRLLKMYGDGGLKKSAVCQMEGVSLKHLREEVGSVQQLIGTLVAAAFPNGGGA